MANQHLTSEDKFVLVCMTNGYLSPDKLFLNVRLTRVNWFLDNKRDLDVRQTQYYLFPDDI